MRAVAVINQKGGVGKTTTTANLAHAIALMGNRVTVIDFDPQGHLSAHFGVVQRNQNGIDQILSGKMQVAQVVIAAREGLQLIPAGHDLVFLERGKEDLSLGQKLKEIVTRYCKDEDFVFIDCPPASGLLIDYALTAVKEILVPVAGDYFALRGLSDLVGNLKQFEKKYSNSFVRWIVVTRFHMRRRLSWEVREKLLEYFPDCVLVTPIRETAALAECPSFGKTAFEYKRGNNGAADYELLAKNFFHGECCGSQE